MPYKLFYGKAYTHAMAPTNPDQPWCNHLHPKSVPRLSPNPERVTCAACRRLLVYPGIQQGRFVLINDYRRGDILAAVFDEDEGGLWCRVYSYNGWGAIRHSKQYRWEAHTHRFYKRARQMLRWNQLLTGR